MAETFFAAEVAVIGVGLIGGSLALGLKKRGAVGKVYGAGRSQKSLQRARGLGVIDAACASPADAAARAELVVLAAPVCASEKLLAEIAPALGDKTIVTDVGSVKTGVCNAAAAALGKNATRFIPGHPVAGREHSGAGAAHADLFENHSVALTPDANTDAAALARVEKMWETLGARVRKMDAARHDRVLALTSHLPHVLAYAMVDCFARAGDDARADMSAGGFSDFTRTASSDPEMWRDICVMNRAEIVRQVEMFQRRLAEISRMLGGADGGALQSLFTSAKQTRARIKDPRAQS